MSQSYSFIAPASIGNFIVGFDTLGLAVKPYAEGALQDTVTVHHADRMQLTVSGEYASWVPLGEDNLVHQAAVLLNGWLREHDESEQQWLLHLEKGLPVASGTGSSAASCVAAVGALCGWLQTNRSIDVPMPERWRLMAQLEGSVSGAAHLDNLAPAVLGGLVLCPATGTPVQLPFFDDWYLLLAYSGQTLKTSQARACLPQEYAAATSIAQMQLMASAVDGLHRGDKNRVIMALQDNFAEPYRRGMIRGYTENRELLQANGALAVGISGAGPAFFAIADSLEQAKILRELVCQNLQLTSGGFVQICQAWYPDIDST